MVKNRMKLLLTIFHKRESSHIALILNVLKPILRFGNLQQPAHYLKSSCKGIFGSEAIKWNFTKFLIDSTGVPIKRYAPIVPPSMIAKDIEKELSK